MILHWSPLYTECSQQRGRELKSDIAIVNGTFDTPCLECRRVCGKCVQEYYTEITGEQTCTDRHTNPFTIFTIRGLRGVVLMALGVDRLRPLSSPELAALGAILYRAHKHIQFYIQITETKRIRRR